MNKQGMVDFRGDSNPTACDLARYREAQESVYAGALGELCAGAKRGHWVWFIFPQIAGLGHSSNAQYYALASAQEAQAYLADPVLGPRLLECTRAVLAVQGRSAGQILGRVDALKFRSSMTLFASIAGSDSAFQQALDNYFRGEPDPLTLEILGRIQPAT